MENIAIGFWWILFCIFFSGYALAYGLASLLAKNKKWNNIIKNRVYPLLPFSYALVTSCFWLYVLYESEPGFITGRITHSILAQLIAGWSLLGLLFWIPAIGKKHFISFLHSIPFFLLPLAFVGKNVIRYGVLERADLFNVFRVYFAGICVYAATVIILLLVKFLVSSFNAFRHHHV